MKSLTKLCLICSLISSTASCADVVLQNFTSVLGPNTWFYGTWEATGSVDGSLDKNADFVQGLGFFDFKGTILVPTENAASKVEFFYTTSFDIGANTFISVTAQALTGNAASSFAVTLFDNAGKSAFAAFATSSFPTGGFTTQIGLLTAQAGFQAANIGSMTISGNQPGSAIFAVSFDNISAVSAVPEPGHYAAMIGVATLGAAAWRRRRVKGESAL